MHTYIHAYIPAIVACCVTAVSQEVSSVAAVTGGYFWRMAVLHLPHAGADIAVPPHASPHFSRDSNFTGFTSRRGGSVRPDYFSLLFTTTDETTALPNQKMKRAQRALLFLSPTHTIENQPLPLVIGSNTKWPEPVREKKRKHDKMEEPKWLWFSSYVWCRMRRSRENTSPALFLMHCNARGYQTEAKLGHISYSIQWNRVHFDARNLPRPTGRGWSVSHHSDPRWWSCVALLDNIFSLRDQ